MDILPPTADRVAMNTDSAINRRIHHRAVKSAAMYSGNETCAIRKRISELDREWDVERTLETSASLLTLAGVILGLTRSRFWFLLSGLAGLFLLLHAIQGWCPPLPLIRKAGVRTAKEIETERVALRQQRGDFAVEQAHTANRKSNPGI